MITIDDFKKLEIKIGKVKSVEKVPNTDKLLKFIIDIGEKEERQILAGIAEFFEDPSILVGKEIPILTNIEPLTLRGYVSHGMILVATADDKPVLLHPEKKVPAGSVVR